MMLCWISPVTWPLIGEAVYVHLQTYCWSDWAQIGLANPLRANPGLINFGHAPLNPWSDPPPHPHPTLIWSTVDVHSLMSCFSCVVVRCPQWVYTNWEDSSTRTHSYCKITAFMTLASSSMETTCTIISTATPESMSSMGVTIRSMLTLCIISSKPWSHAMYLHMSYLTDAMKIIPAGSKSLDLEL